jgi:methyl-accepting chemotaxis protein
MSDEIKKDVKLQPTGFDEVTRRLTRWIGSTSSLVTHTIIFAGVIVAPVFGFAMDHVLLVLTTIVSLEAIYLAILIQYTINRHSETLEEVVEDIEEVAEDVEEVTKNVEEISEDVEDISEDVEDISEDVEELSSEARKESASSIGDYSKIENTLKQLLNEIENIRSKQTPPK